MNPLIGSLVSPPVVSLLTRASSDPQMIPLLSVTISSGYAGCKAQGTADCGSAGRERVSTNPIACFNFWDRDRFTSISEEPSSAVDAILGTSFVSLDSLDIDGRVDPENSLTGIDRCLKLRLRVGRDPARSRVCEEATF